MSMKKLSLLAILFLILITLTRLSDASITYTVEKSISDETFIINDNVYKAKTYCFNVMEGDQVVFIEGSAFGACVSAEFLNTRSNSSCAVWCE